MPTRLSRRLARSNRLFSDNAYASVARAAQSMVLSNKYPPRTSSQTSDAADAQQSPPSAAPQSPTVKVTATVTSTTTSSGLVRTKRIITRQIMGANKQCPCCVRKAAGKFIEHFEDDDADGHEHHDHDHAASSPSTSKSGSSPSKSDTNSAALSDDSAADTGLDRCYPHCRFYDHDTMEDPTTQPFRHDKIYTIEIVNIWPDFEFCDNLVDCFSHYIELRFGEEWNGWPIELQVLRDELEPERELRRLAGSGKHSKKLKKSAKNVTDAVTTEEEVQEDDEKEKTQVSEGSVVEVRTQSKGEETANIEKFEKIKENIRKDLERMEKEKENIRMEREDIEKEKESIRKEKESIEQEMKSLNITYDPGQKAIKKTKRRNRTLLNWPLHKDTQNLEQRTDLRPIQLQAIINASTLPSTFDEMVDCMDGMKELAITLPRAISSKSPKNRPFDEICGNLVFRSANFVQKAAVRPTAIDTTIEAATQAGIWAKRKDSAMSLPPALFASKHNRESKVTNI